MFSGAFKQLKHCADVASEEKGHNPHLVLSFV